MFSHTHPPAGLQCDCPSGHKTGILFAVIRTYIGIRHSLFVVTPSGVTFKGKVPLRATLRTGASEARPKPDNRTIRNCPIESGWPFLPQALVGRVVRKPQPVGLFRNSHNRWDSYGHTTDLNCDGLVRYTDAMTAKEKVIRTVQSLPDDASIEDAMERLLLLAKVERGLQQAEAGQLIPHEEVKERMAKWLK